MKTDKNHTHRFNWQQDTDDLTQALPSLSTLDGIHPNIIAYIEFLMTEVQRLRWTIKKLDEVTNDDECLQMLFDSRYGNMKLKQKSNDVTYSSKDLHGGVPLFLGTTIPVYMVLEYLSKGWSVPDLKEVYPTIKQKYIYQVLENLSHEYKG